MVDNFTSPNFAPEVRRDEVLLEAQRLAVSARDMLAAAAYAEHHRVEWWEAKESAEVAQPVEVAVDSTEPTSFTSKAPAEALSEAPWTMERLIGHISLIGQWVNYVRDEELALRK